MSAIEQKAEAFCSPTSLSNTAEIVTAQKVSRKLAHAAPIAHYRNHFRSNSVELRKHTQSKESNNPASVVAIIGSPRFMPSPVPPPTSALPPTPGVSAVTLPTLGGHDELSHRRSNGSSYAAPSILSRSIRKMFRHLSAGLTPEEHSELVQKVLTDLRPAHASTTVLPFSRASRPNSKVSHTRSNKMSFFNSNEAVKDVANTKTAGKRLSASSQGTGSSSSRQSSDEKLGTSQITSTTLDPSTPQLSRSRSPTPTTSVNEMSRNDTKEKVKGPEIATGQVIVDDEKATLSPKDALESLRVLENTFERSNPNSPLEATFTKDSTFSQTTAVASPTKNAAETQEASVAFSNTGGSVSPPPRSKRSSSYRKSVPTLGELTNGGKKAQGISSQSSSTASSVRTSSPSSADMETPSWIVSLTTLEAIRVLAFQQGESVGTQSGLSKSSAIPAETSASTNEVSALRYALNFTLNRADKLAEALNRATEEKTKVESELEILRRNVLSMLGSKPMFVASSSPQSCYESNGSRQRMNEDDDIAEKEKDADHHVEVAGSTKSVPASATRQHDALSRSNSVDTTAAAATVSRPLRAGDTPRAAPSTTNVTVPAKSSGGVSIASLRKNLPFTNVAASADAQRYAPSSRKGPSVDGEEYGCQPEQDGEDEDEDDEFDMYPFGAPIRKAPSAQPGLSMTDFLNASRMSNAEIAERDARMELEREDSSAITDFHSAASSTSSHAPLYKPSSMRSLDPHRRGFFKGITKLVDQERAKHTSRRTLLISRPSLASLSPKTTTLISRSNGGIARSTPSTNLRNSKGNGFTLAYEEKLIIPNYLGTTPSAILGARSNETRQKTASVTSDLSESFERQSLREARMRVGQKQQKREGAEKWSGSEAHRGLAIPLI